MKKISHIFILACLIAFASANIGDRLLELETLVQNQLSENDYLISCVKELEDEAAELMALDSVAEKTEQADQFASIVREYLPEVANLTIDNVFKRDVGPTTAFHTFHSTNRCYNDHETMIFDSEALDEGGFGDVGIYDKRDGIFEPPTTGVYVFTWTTAANSATKFTTELIISGQVAGVMTSDYDSSASSGIHPATAVVVAHVPAGTHCYIRVRTSATCASVLSDSNSVRTTFSAWKLFSQ